jgi:hypothetical protein
MSQLSRLVIATLAFVCSWLITAAFDALRAPAAAMFVGGAVILLSIAAVIATLHRWARAGDEGGGGPRRRSPDHPQPEGGGSDPSWWPEFERQLASYVAEQEREKPPVRCPPD